MILRVLEADASTNPSRPSIHGMVDQRGEVAGHPSVEHGDLWQGEVRPGPREIRRLTEIIFPAEH